MLIPARQNTLPGLFLAALPPAAVLGFGLAFLSLIGGRAELWRLVDTVGLYSLLMVVAILGVMGVLSGLLCMGLSGRHAPLVLLVGLATLPWFLGIAGTQEAMERVLAAVPEVGGGAAVTVLVAVTGEAMVTRLLGAWASAALLAAVALGLVLLCERTAQVGENVGRLLGAALGLVLGGLALLVALEAHHFFELLTTLASRVPEAHARLIAGSTEHLLRLHALRSAALGVLAVLALALVCWQFFLRAGAVEQRASSVMLVALAAAVLLLDARPLQLAARGAQEAGLSRILLPMLVLKDPSNTLGTVPPVHFPSTGLRPTR